MNQESVRWVEDQAKQLAAFQERVVEALEKQASGFLNLLLAGAGGSLAYAVNLAEKQAATWQQVGMSAVSVWLFMVAALVLWRAMWSREIHPPANEPDNLKAAYDMPLVEVMSYQLEHSQTAIRANRLRNDSVGRALNQSRIMAAATPLVFAIAAWAVC